MAYLRLGGARNFLSRRGFHNYSRRPARHGTRAGSAGQSRAEKALVYNMHPFVADLLGTITAAGGGTIRDIFRARVPLDLHTEVYATAAIIGSTCLVIGRKPRLSPAAAALLGRCVCFGLRVVAALQHWNLPEAFNP